MWPGVRFPDSPSYVGWVCCWFSSLLREIFLPVLRFSPLLKNQHFQIPIRSRKCRHAVKAHYLIILSWNYALHKFIYLLQFNLSNSIEQLSIICTCFETAVHPTQHYSEGRLHELFFFFLNYYARNSFRNVIPRHTCTSVHWFSWEHAHSSPHWTQTCYKRLLFGGEKLQPEISLRSQANERKPWI